MAQAALCLLVVLVASERQLAEQEAPQSLVAEVALAIQHLLEMAEQPVGQPPLAGLHLRQLPETPRYQVRKQG